LAPLSDGEFESIDRAVMGCCFAAQNHLGRLCDELVYERDVAVRLHSEGFRDVRTQIPVRVLYEDFTKTYRLDLVVSRMLYEFKTVAALAPEHQTQAIHYAALGSTDRVKLVNFRSSKVIGRLLRSPFTQAERRSFVVSEARWRPMSDSCSALSGRMKALLADWGGFLEARLYEQALIHSFGGEVHCRRRLPVTRDGIALGFHRLPCHAERVGFVVTALTREIEAYEAHLRRLLRCLPLHGIQWLNLDHTELQLITLSDALQPCGE
jgi:GxxExxY protein